MLENIRETDQNGQRYATPFERVYKLLKVDIPARFLGWVNPKTPVLPNREIPFAPTCNIVKLCCIAYGPSISRFTYLGGDSDLGVQLEECSFGVGSSS
jgi:hypothetical protein